MDQKNSDELKATGKLLVCLSDRIIKANETDSLIFHLYQGFLKIVAYD